MKSKLLFSTQIYQEKITPKVIALKSLLKEITIESFQIKKLDAAGRLWSKLNYPNGYTSYSSLDQVHQMSSTFGELEKLIRIHVAKFLKNLDYNVTVQNLKMTDCWVNIMSKNTIHTAHLHPKSIISGTFYVLAPKDCSGIKFHDPRTAQFMNTPQIKSSAKIHNQRFFTLNPKPGDIVLFESWLMHEVPLNISKEPRISISFNYDWK